MEIEKLKAEAYDALAQIEYWQARLEQLNNKIVELNKLEQQNGNKIQDNNNK